MVEDLSPIYCTLLIAGLVETDPQYPAPEPSLVHTCPLDPAVVGGYIVTVLLLVTLPYASVVMTGTAVALPTVPEEPTVARETVVPDTEMPVPAVTEPPLALIVLPEMVMLEPAVSLSCLLATVVFRLDMSLSQVPIRVAVLDETL